MIRIVIALGVFMVFGLVGSMDRAAEERLAAHVAERDREVAREAAREAALRRQAEWAILLREGERLTNFPAIARK